MLANRQVAGSSVAGARVAKPAVALAPVRAAAASRKAQRPALARRLSVQAMKVGEKLQDSAEYYRVLKTSEGKTLSLASLAGKPLVLFFYPKAATPGCTKEVCKFRDEYEAFQKAGAVVYGISGDSPEANKAFATAQRVPFPLFTDPSSILRKTFGIKGDLLGLLPGRQTYVFDASGKCVLSFNDQLNAEKHVEEALAALKNVKVAA